MEERRERVERDIKYLNMTNMVEFECELSLPFSHLIGVCLLALSIYESSVTLPVCFTETQ
jgi:hypothetical protein